MMKKLLTMLLALTVLAIFSVGHAETRVDSLKVKPVTISTLDENLEKIQPQSMTSEKGKSFYMQEGETRPVLSASLFVGRASKAYAAAKQYPEVMDQVFCYCECDQPPTYHKTLLSCFTDNHGKG
jgi:hypothetical protein